MYLNSNFWICQVFHDAHAWCRGWNIANVTVFFWNHDNVIKWKHFSHSCPFVWGIHRSTMNSPHKGQWRRALMFSLICVWINDWVNNHEAGDLRRYRAHYDVIVMEKGCYRCHHYFSQRHAFLFHLTGYIYSCLEMCFSKGKQIYVCIMGHNMLYIISFWLIIIKALLASMLTLLTFDQLQCYSDLCEIEAIICEALSLRQLLMCYKGPILLTWFNFNNPSMAK